MALSVTGEQVESVLRKVLPQQGYKLKNAPRKKGETGADIIAEKYQVKLAIECIGFQEVPPLRSKQFYEAFFRTVSRLKDGAHRCVMALPARFGCGMNARAKHYGEAWRRIAEAFPELEIWLVDVRGKSYEAHKWNDWPTSDSLERGSGPVRRRGKWSPREGTISHLVRLCLLDNPEVSYEELRKRVLQKFPWSRFNKSHFAWYKSRLRKSES